MKTKTPFSEESFRSRLKIKDSDGAEITWMRKEEIKTMTDKSIPQNLWKKLQIHQESPHSSLFISNLNSTKNSTKSRTFKTGQIRTI